MYLVNLPSEVIALVLEFLQVGPRHSRDITSVASTCHALRQQAVSFLFAELHLTVHDHRLTSRSRWILSCLQRACIGVLRHVRSITEHTVGHNVVVPRACRARASSSSTHTTKVDDTIEEDGATAISDAKLIEECGFNSVQCLRLVL